MQMMYFHLHYFCISTRRSLSPEEIKPRKILTESYLISDEADTIITKKTAGCVRMEFLMRLLGCYGKYLEKKS